MITTESKIEKILHEKFNPESLEVINESYKHAGHGDFDGSGETHFKIMVSSKNISGNSRIEKHRTIISALNEIIPEIHALQIELK